MAGLSPDDLARPEAADDAAARVELGLETLVAEAMESVIEVQCHAPVDTLAAAEDADNVFEAQYLPSDDASGAQEVQPPARNHEATLQAAGFCGEANGKKPPTRSQRRRRLWNEGFHVIPTDHRFPPPLRRYFDELPTEVRPPRSRPRLHSTTGTSSDVLDTKSRQLGRPSTTTTSQQSVEWVDEFAQVPSTDNDGIHRHLRHYFDRRGMEVTVRLRPSADSPWFQGLRPRTPQRPSTEELVLKHSASAPEIKTGAAARGDGDIRWGRRCLLYGGQKRSPYAVRLPWVTDHQKQEADDNEALNPLLRHYFDKEGMEASFRSRGRHFARPTKSVFGCGGMATTTSGLLKVGADFVKPTGA